MKIFKRTMVVAMAALMVFALVACGGQTNQSGSEDGENPAKGNEVASESFPKFEGADFEGNKVDESIFKENKVTVLNFWFNGCSACVNEMPALEKFNQTLKEYGAEIVGVNVEANSGEDKLQEAKDILSKQGATFRNIMINGDKEAKAFLSEIMAFPTTILVDENGKMIGKPITGNIDNEKTLNEILEMVKKASSGETIVEETIDPGVETEPEITGEQDTVQNPELIALNGEMNKIFASHEEMWNKIFPNAPKEKVEMVDVEITYGDYLYEALEKSKEFLTAEEQELAKKDIERISELHEKIRVLVRESGTN